MRVRPWIAALCAALAAGCSSEPAVSDDVRAENPPAAIRPRRNEALQPT
jgi:hypothetical protein